MTSSEPIRLDSPTAIEALRIIDRLRDAGFIAYLAGGCVRDALLGREPKDYDVATNATPDSVREVFGKPKTLAFGASFGVIGVLPEKSTKRASSRREQSVLPTEVATFRSDGTYSDGRRPDEVVFGDAQQDALRRDFTINGLFYDPHQSIVIDFVGGRDDLVARRLRTIGSADERFDEDKLRMLRAIRFATTLGFDLEPGTQAAITQHAGEIVQVSGERIGAEMRRVLTSESCASGLSMLMQTKLAPFVLPELREVDLSRAGRLLDRLRVRSFAASLACVALCYADPKSLIDATTRRWKLSNEENRKASFAVKHVETLMNAHQLDWSQVQPILVDRDGDLAGAVADAVADGDDRDRDGIALVQRASQWSIEKLDPPMLITGDDLNAAGFPTGPHYKEWLQSVRDRQLDGEIESVEEAWEVIRRLADGR